MPSGGVACLLALVLMALVIPGQGKCAPPAGIDDPPVIVVYYANETSASAIGSDNYRTLLRWLEHSAEAPAEGIKAQIERDAELFPSAIAEEIDLLTSAVARQPRVGALFMTNDSVLAGTATVMYPEASVPQSVPTPPLSVPHAVLRHSPLATEDGLLTSLRWLVTLFDPQRFRYALIIKSHGATRMALMPRVWLDTGRVEQDAVEGLLRNHRSVDTFPDWAQPLGVSKARFIDILAQGEGELGMRFDLVFLDACRSGLNARHTARLGVQPQRFYHAGSEPLPYRGVAYDTIPAAPSANDFLEHLAETIEAALPMDWSTDTLAP